MTYGLYKRANWFKNTARKVIQPFSDAVRTLNASANSAEIANKVVASTNTLVNHADKNLDLLLKTLAIGSGTAFAAYTGSKLYGMYRKHRLDKLREQKLKAAIEQKTQSASDAVDDI